MTATFIFTPEYFQNLMISQMAYTPIEESKDKSEYSKVVQATVDLRGLYSTLKAQPALMDRRLRIGGKLPPQLPPTEPINNVVPIYTKRSAFDIGVAQPSCPFSTEWVRLSYAMDINNTLVKVFQPSDNNSNRFQWFYTVTCDHDTLLFEDENCPFCCRAINHSRFSSQCVPRKSYVMALMRRSPAYEFDWGYIQVDSSCNCAVAPKD